MKRDELIKLYLSDLNNIVPQSPARDNRIAMLEKELASQPEAVVLPSDEEIETKYCLIDTNNLNGFQRSSVEMINQTQRERIDGAKWLKSQAKQGYEKEFVLWLIDNRVMSDREVEGQFLLIILPQNIIFKTLNELHNYWLTEIKDNLLTSK